MALSIKQFLDNPIPVTFEGAAPGGGGVASTVSVSNFPGSQPVTGTFWPNTQPVSFTWSGLTDTQLRANPLAVTGAFYPATQAVTGTFWQATQPVSIAGTVATSDNHTTAGAPISVRLTDGSTFYSATGGGGAAGTEYALTDTQLRATAVPVTGTFYQATQPVSLASVPTHGVTGTFWQATQPVSGTFYQATQPVSIATMPTTPVTGTFFQATQPVSLAGSVAVTGSFYQATQPVSIASMPSTPVTGTFWQATQPVSGPLTDTQLRATAVPVTLASTTITGSVAVTGSFYPATQPVSGTFYQATQPVSIAATVPVSGPLTDTQIRATALPVSGTFYQATQPVSGTFWQATQPISGTVAVTGTFWQATQPVSIAGTVTVSNGQSQPLTDTQLRASAVPVSLASVPTHGVTLPAATLIVSTTAAAGSGVTVTLPAVASQFHYITRINIVKYASVAVVGGAAPVVVTSTNLPGSVAWTTPTAMAVGTNYETDVEPKAEIRSSVVNTATTIVCPATTSIIWRVTVYYYTAA